MVATHQQRRGIDIAYAPAIVIDDIAVINADISVVGIGITDIDNVTGAVDRARRINFTGRVGNPATSDVDDRARFNHHIGSGGDIAAKSISPERDVAAL